MKNLKQVFILFSVIFLFNNSFLMAQEESKMSNEEIYDLYSIITLKEAYKHALKAAIYLSKDREKGLEELNKLMPSKFNSSPYGLSVTVMDYKKDNALAISIGSLKGLLKMKNIVSSYKDAEGKLVGVELRREIKRQPKGACVCQNQWWHRSKGPITNVVLITQVPDSDLVVSTNLAVKDCEKNKCEIEKWWEEGMAEFGDMFD